MNLTQRARKANLKTWKATSPAIVAEPLKRIHQHYPDRKSSGGARIGFDPRYLPAHHAAQRGDGAEIKRIARSLGL